MAKAMRFSSREASSVGVWASNWAALSAVGDVLQCALQDGVDRLGGRIGHEKYAEAFAGFDTQWVSDKATERVMWVTCAQACVWHDEW
ncbi:hypothetical protein BVH03_13590 [Pseudomonas sp. PA15(2017)]|uniref:hypothetical protein n=1 Tax=Pseudomonas sp. PA15(2017) TaxID=1932111 RepID=UPI00096681FA|nr:hypothetical protein [Pseudomonas sp. PA15(2017)]OLU27753.1 hypothetical protein BVH03_13590 [Pseudomonas sp. PA15(2017)]